MKTKFILAILCTFPVMANAAIPYRAEQIKSIPTQTPSGIDNEAYARDKRFYIGGMYNFAMWQNFTDDTDITINGENSTSFEAVAGLRIYDTFRMELNYIRTNAEYNTLSLSGDTFFVNAIFDARIDSIYRIFRTQMLVPYVGLGAGLSWNSADDITLERKISPTAAALAGIAIEFNQIFALDFGYRYFYMFNPGTETIKHLNPTAHQFRAGVRISF
ncbi:MAG: outer membrane beta-barrel protein [Alphaproteobacteria bacterium]|nr:outer membrane beta-barrel protein [Alphaproteobacteria bacterium]